VVVGKELTASIQPALSITTRIMRLTPLGLQSVNQAPMAGQLADKQVINDHRLMMPWDPALFGTR
jgi:hypothetical protein